MAIQATIKMRGLNELRTEFRTMFDKAKKEDGLNVVVGYHAPHAVYVHENPGMVLKGIPRPSGRGAYWDAKAGPGRHKFLEGPARRLEGKLGEIIIKTLLRGGTLTQALTLAGIHLMRESKKEVPYEFGDLHDSAFVRKE